MAHDVSDDNYCYHRRKDTLKWTALEVANLVIIDTCYYVAIQYMFYRQYITRNTQFRVMCGVLDV